MALAQNSSRYVLVYTARTVPQGFSLVPQSMEFLAKEQSLNEDETHCCQYFGTWADPHLTHLISLVCSNPGCGRKTGNLLLSATEYKVEGENGATKTHLVKRCSSMDCPDSMTKVRILRRGRGPLFTGGDHKPVLEVEVIGKMTVNEESVPCKYFEVYAEDGQGNLYKANNMTANSDGSWDLQVEGGHGTIEGFRGLWVMTAWEDSSHDRFGLRIRDSYSSAKEDWPPEEWSSGSSSSSDEEGVQAAAGHEEGNENAAVPDDEDEAAAAGHENGNGNDGDYVPSDAESAA